MFVAVLAGPRAPKVGISERLYILEVGREFSERASWTTEGTLPWAVVEAIETG